MRNSMLACAWLYENVVDELKKNMKYHIVRVSLQAHTCFQVGLNQKYKSSCFLSVSTLGEYDVRHEWLAVYNKRDWENERREEGKHDVHIYAHAGFLESKIVAEKCQVCLPIIICSWVGLSWTITWHYHKLQSTTLHNQMMLFKKVVYTYSGHQSDYQHIVDSCMCMWEISWIAEHIYAYLTYSIDRCYNNHLCSFHWSTRHTNKRRIIITILSFVQPYEQHFSSGLRVYIW